MSPRLTLIALSLLLTKAASAQQSLGIQAGFGWSKIEIDLYDGRDSRGPQLNLGLNYERFLSKRFSLGADLLFQQRGTRDLGILYDLNGQPVGTAYLRFHYDYLALPLKAGYTVGRKGFGFGKLGLVPALLLKATMTTPDGFFAGNQTSYPFTSSCNRFDLGGIAELGGGVHFSRGFQLFGSLTYQHSLTRITRDGPVLTTERYHGWNLNAGLRYELPATRKPGPAPTAG